MPLVLPNAKHIANAGINKPNTTNNRIERMHGTLRERNKAQRGWKSFATPLAEGMRIQYNFVKPNQALSGQTPAQAARFLSWQRISGWTCYS